MQPARVKKTDMIKLTHKLIDPATPAATLTLPWEQRIRSRLRVALDDGAEAGLFLPRGTVLDDGDLLGDANGIVVRVRAAEETVSTVVSDDPLAMARACYHLGNRHTPLEIAAGRIRYQHDPVLDEMVRGLGLAVRVDRAPFAPEAGAYGGSSGDGHHHHG